MLRIGVLCLAALSRGTDLSAEQWAPADTHAVIVGVLEWKNGLTPYPKAHRKDVELRDVLVSRGTPSDNITMLLDENATLPNVREAVTKMAASTGPDSTLIIYYAGHGMPSGDSDFCFANYEMMPGKPQETGWTLKELGETLVNEFKGDRVLLFADCCYSGGLQIVVDRLAEAGIAAAQLTSAGPANTSTNNWTFTQSLIDGLRGEPLVDQDDDGAVTLGELAIEVRDAMQHLEGQVDGFKSDGVADDFVMAKSSGARADRKDATFALGSYVVATDGGRARPGRVVASEGDQYTVQFYDYSDKRTARYVEKDLTASTREPARPPAVLDAGQKPDCEVEWKGSWWPAKILRQEDSRTFIHYLGYAASWDEWVDKSRIRIPDTKAR